MTIEQVRADLEERQRELASGLAQLQANLHATQGALSECARLLALLDTDSEPGSESPV